MGKLLHTKRRATLTVASNNINYGTVSGGGIRRPRPYTTTITATPRTGYSFVQWNDGNTTANRSVTVTDNIVYTATFRIAQTNYYIFFNVEPQQSGKLWYTIYDERGNILELANTTTSESFSKNDIRAYRIACDSTPDVGYEFGQWYISGCDFMSGSNEYSMGVNLNNFTTTSNSEIGLIFRETASAMPEIPTTNAQNYIANGIPLAGAELLVSQQNVDTNIYLAPANINLGRDTLSTLISKNYKYYLEKSSLSPNELYQGLIVNSYNNGFISVGGKSSNLVYPMKITGTNTSNTNFTLNIGFKIPSEMNFQYVKGGQIISLKEPDGINTNYALISSNNFSSPSSLYKTTEVYDGKSIYDDLNPGYWMLAIHQATDGQNYLMFKYHNAMRKVIYTLFSQTPFDELVNYVTLVCTENKDSESVRFEMYINGSPVSLTSVSGESPMHPLSKGKYTDFINMADPIFNQVPNVAPINLGVNERGGGYLANNMVIYKYSILPESSNFGQVQAMCESFFNGKSTHIMK